MGHRLVLSLHRHTTIKRTSVKSALLTAIALSFVVAPSISFPMRASADETIHITEFLIPTTDVIPTGITAGPDGNLWFTEPQSNKIGKITPNGVITEFSLPVASGGPYGITTGPDGNLWFTELGSRIGRITPEGVVTEFPLPFSHFVSNPYDITTGSDGNLWFIANGSETMVGKITPAGTVTVFPISSTGSSFIASITTGPDGNVWFTDSGANSIGRITPEGVITEFSIPTANSLVVGVGSGPDGNIWFTEYMGQKIGRITPEGVVTEFPLPSSNASVNNITSGPDGNLWFTEDQANNIGRITSNGIVTEFSIPTANSNVFDITTGPDGNLWFTGNGSNKIGRVEISTSTLLQTPIEKAKAVIGGYYTFGAKGWDILQSKYLSPTQIKTGVDYQTWTGATIRGLDCSGLSLWSYNSSLEPSTIYPHNGSVAAYVKYENADGQYRHNTNHILTGSEQPGDLMFFDWNGDTWVDHVALYTGPYTYNGQNYDVVHASGPATGISPATKVGLAALSGFVGFGKIKEPDVSLNIKTSSPIDLIVIDPQGITITPTSTTQTSEESLHEVPGELYYSVYARESDGTPKTEVYSPRLKMGNYIIRPLKRVDAPVGSVYTITVVTDVGAKIIANDVPVNQIPVSGYGVTVTGSGITTFVPDITPPSTSSGVTATSSSSTSISLKWATSTDNVGVTGYKIERCTGAACTNFVHIATSTATSYTNTGLAASTTYRFRIRAFDGAGNVSGYSAIVSATTKKAATPVTIFYDGFETALNWTKVGDTLWYTGTPKIGTHAAKLKTTGSIEKTISLATYKDITIAFKMGAGSLDTTSENVQALYYNGTAWVTLATIANGSVNENNLLNPYSFVLPTTMNNKSTFKLKFKINASAIDDYGYIDEIKVVGVKI